MNDIVMFVFNESEYCKGGMDWRLSKIAAVSGTQVSVSYSLIKLSYLATLLAFQLASFYTNTTQLLAAISNFFFILCWMNCTVVNNIYFSMSGAEYLRKILETRWEKLRLELQTWSKRG